jgi:molybdopterin molybdotransferase
MIITARRTADIMIDYAQAVARLLAHAAPLPSESCALADALWRVSAQRVTSPSALPSFDHAAMDGYALAAGAVVPAGSEHAVHGSQAAGDVAVVSGGAAWEIMTGARLPDGLDAVVAVERTQLLSSRDDGAPQRIRLLDDVASGRNVRHTGSDVAKGTIALEAGTCIEPSHIMLLAALGIAELAVVRRPRVAVICTGKELEPDLRAPLAAERIYNSNGPYLAAALAACGAQLLFCETVDDTAVTYAAALGRAVAAGADLVVSTGAVSMGRYDFVPNVLRQCGAELLFHKVAIRPGKPQLAAMLPEGPLVMALPGTPMAVAVGLRFFVAPVLRAMSGQAAEPVFHALLDTPQQAKPGLRHFLRARLGLDGQGRLHADVQAQQQPFRIQPFAQGDAWVILPEPSGEAPQGGIVEVASLHPGVGLSVQRFLSGAGS